MGSGPFSFWTEFAKGDRFPRLVTKPSSCYVLFKEIVFLFYSRGNNFYVSGLDSLADIV
jgi:hypothetical protein